MSVEIQDSAVLERLKKMGDTATLTQVMKDCCLLVEADAKRKAPVITGNLRSSIQSVVTADSGEIVGEVGTPLIYGNYVEFGTGLYAAKGNGRKQVPWYYEDAKGKGHFTKGQKPKPFLHPSLEKNKHKIIDNFKGALKDG